MNRQFIYVALLAFVTLWAVGPSFAADKVSKTGKDFEFDKASFLKQEKQDKQLSQAEQAKLKAQLTSAYRALRQGESYGALQKLWRVRKSLRAQGDKATLRKLERVMVLVQRGDGMAARVRLKSVIRK